MTASEVIRLLDLKPLPEEGGYYRETYRSKGLIPHDALSPHYPDLRSHSTAIYYLLTVGRFSHMHRLTGDEVFHFYLGDPSIMLQIHTDGSSEVIILGQDIAGGQQLQVDVPGGIWQGMKLADGGEWALMGTTVAPGFEFEDYIHGDRAKLIALCPDQEELIRELTGV